MQVKSAPDGQKKFVLSTHRGVLLQTRLSYGIRSNPGYFQVIMDQLTRDLQMVATYMDDILVSGATADEHLQSLPSLLQRVYRTKAYAVIRECSFDQPWIGCLGHPMSRDGFIKGRKADATSGHKRRKQPSHRNGTAANW